jgi:hypothetical protein
MHTDLGGGERLVHQSGANLQRGIETVGGHLLLTTRRLIFEAHRFNVQTGRTIIPLRDVVDVWKCWTKFLGLIPIFPNSLAVATARGKTYKFVLFGRDTWIRLIRETQQDLEERDRADEEDEEADDVRPD